jgi:hypothetical protein
MSYEDPRIDAILAAAITKRTCVASDAIYGGGDKPTNFYSSARDILRQYIDTAKLAEVDTIVSDTEDGTNPTVCTLPVTTMGVMLIPSDSLVNSEHKVALATLAYTSREGKSRSRVCKVLTLKNIAWICILCAGNDGESTTEETTDSSGLTVTTPGATWRTGANVNGLPLLRVHFEQALAKLDAIENRGQI